MNAEQSIPLLIDYVSHGQNVSYAASQLAAEGIDITEPLRMASSRAGNTWEKAALVELCLERDMLEGYDLAVQVLRSKEPHAEYSQKEVYQYIRKYTGLNGSYEEVANWLQENKPNWEAPAPYLPWTDAADLVIDAVDKAIQNKTVTVDFAYMMEDATWLSCSEFVDAVVSNM